MLLPPNPRVVIVTANLGGIDRDEEPVPQSVPCDYHRFTDANFPPRAQAMSPRLQAKLPKMFAWQMLPGYDCYIWTDSSFTVSDPDTAVWFLEQCRDVEAVFFRHPHRESIQAEHEFVERELAAGNAYLVERYAGELLDEELAEMQADAAFRDDFLCAAGAFGYRPTQAVQRLFRDWWYFTSRYNLLDQTSLPYVIRRSRAEVRLIEQDIYGIPYLAYVGHRQA